MMTNKQFNDLCLLKSNFTLYSLTYSKYYNISVTILGFAKILISIMPKYCEPTTEPAIYIFDHGKDFLENTLAEFYEFDY